MVELSKKIGEMEYDGLFAALIPPKQVCGGTIKKLSAAATYKRGTILSKSTEDGMLRILGTTADEGDTLTPDCILCDDTQIGTDADVAVTVYTAGCFNTNKVTVGTGYSITGPDMDKLRERDIVFKAASAAV